MENKEKKHLRKKISDTKKLLVDFNDKFKSFCNSYKSMRVESASLANHMYLFKQNLELPGHSTKVDETLVDVSNGLGRMVEILGMIHNEMDSNIMPSIKQFTAEWNQISVAAKEYSQDSWKHRLRERLNKRKEVTNKKKKEYLDNKISIAFTDMKKILDEFIRSMVVYHAKGLEVWSSVLQNFVSEEHIFPDKTLNDVKSAPVTPLSQTLSGTFKTQAQTEVEVV